MLAGIGPTREAIPSVSIIFNSSASAALSVAKESSQTVEFQDLRQPSAFVIVVYLDVVLSR